MACSTSAITGNRPILMDLIVGAAALNTGRGDEWPGGSVRPAFMRNCIRIAVNGIRAR